MTLDIAVHLGTLVAVIIYLRHELLRLITGSFDWLLTRVANEDSRLAFKLAVATLPAGAAGFLFRSIIEANARSLDWLRRRQSSLPSCYGSQIAPVRGERAL